MTIFEILDIKYQEVSLALGKEYSVFNDGRAKAIHALIGAYRTISKWLSIPVLLTECALVKLHVMKEPISPLKTPKEIVENPQDPSKIIA